MSETNSSLPKRFTCYVIGEDSLLIRCSELLLAQGHEILGVIAHDPNIRQWADDNGIKALFFDNELSDHLKTAAFDYLFSISNFYLLPDDIISLPEISAINYHDGPLPAYAGLNVTSWAIMNGSKQHGVTWHRMSSGIDKGDILKQVLFEVDDDETTLSLNAKCFEHGYSSFRELIVDLSDGTPAPKAQKFHGRTYFGKYKRPKQAAVIDWNRSAEEISSFVRALDFGQYPNPLGCAKIKVADGYFIANRVSLRSNSSTEPPGTISEIDGMSICVATRTKDIAIEKVMSIDGRPLSINDLAAKFSLTAGFRFHVF